MRRLLTAAALLLLATASRASTMEVRYSLRPFVMIAGEIRGLAGTGTVEIAYPASSSVPASSTGSGFSAQPGPVALLGGSLQASGFLPSPIFGPPNGLEVKMHLTLQPAAGTLLPAGTLRLPLIPGVGGMTFHCIGNCYPYPFPNSVPSTTEFDALQFAWSAPGHLAGTLQPGALVPHKFLLSSTSGITAALQVTNASEIDRHYVPEPDILPGMLAGLAALALLARRRR